jgi:enamine deaminase RidA (YjgF/YER057c/UK114 family)
MNDVDTASKDEDVQETDGDEPDRERFEISQDMTKCPFCTKDSEFHTHGLFINHLRKKHMNLEIVLVDKKERQVSGLKRGRPPHQRASYSENVDLISRPLTRFSNERAIVRQSSGREVANLSISDGEVVTAHVFNELVSRFKALEDKVDALERSRTSMRHALVEPFDPTTKIQRIQVGERSVSNSAGFSPIVTFGRLVWLTGITACFENVEVMPIQAQMRQSLDYMVKLLERAGTDVLHLISIKVYLNDIRDMGPCAKIWEEYFSEMGIEAKDRPVRNTCVSQSKDRRLLVELHAHAVLPGEGEIALPHGRPPRK